MRLPVCVIQASVRRNWYASTIIKRDAFEHPYPEMGVGSMSGRKTTPLVFAALGVCLNMIGSFLAMMLHLPIYMDTVGTIFVSLFCGPVYGVCSALLSSIVNAAFDPFALPFIPNGITAAIFASLLRHPHVAKLPLLLKTLIVSLPCSVVSASISAYIFGGITSAASSYIVQFLYGAMHLPLVLSAFIVQIGTDYADKLLIITIVTLFIARIPTHIKEKI